MIDNALVILDKGVFLFLSLRKPFQIFFNMKSKLFILLLVLVGITVHAQVTKNQADSIVLRQVLDPSLMNNVDVYRFSQPLSDSDDIQSYWGNTFDAPFQSFWGYFIDLYPFANWSHPCKACLVSITDGRCFIKDTDRPPYQWNIMVLVQMAPRPTPVNHPLVPVTGQRLSAPETDPHLWAVMLCTILGSHGDYDPRRRFWGDLSCVYTTLTNVFGFQENTLSNRSGMIDMSNSHIFVLAPLTLSAFDTDLNHSSFHNIENDFLCLPPSNMNYNTELGGYFSYN